VPNINRTTCKAPPLPYASVVIGIHTQAPPIPCASVDIGIDFLCRTTSKNVSRTTYKEVAQAPPQYGDFHLYLTTYGLDTLRHTVAVVTNQVGSLIFCPKYRE
jgi:hypothetical protein